MPKTDIIVIVGPTASGKSALAIALAKKYGGEVISADSRQVYRGLDIGSGKVTKREMRGVPHHMLDIVSPKKIYTAYDFARDAREAIEDIRSRQKVPIICGGTGFYIDALLGRTTLSDVPPQPKLREKLRKETASELFAQLKKLDPRRACTIDRHNSVRLIRAIEIAFAGKTRSKQQSKQQKALPYHVTWIGIQPDDATLRSNITKRLHARMKQGLVAEARRLHASGLSWKRMEDLGLEYRSLARFLQKTISKEEMLSELEHAIWQYAKRQKTYWRRNKEIRWFDSGKDTIDVA